jgi:GNAT superfamily N-acetyltransferase
MQKNDAHKTIIRFANAADVPAIHSLIRQLAIYEKAKNEHVCSQEELLADGFGKNPAFECLIAEVENQVVGIALFYQKYSTWKGKCIFLDDIVVDEKYRRMGIGEQLLLKLKSIALERKVRKLEWQVLDWNEPAINFYQKLEAELDSEWINCKFTLRID